jgi:ubiquinol-cytochrome c reductase iron-sulfur subunit
MWKEGSRLVTDPELAPIKAADVTVGSVFHVMPEGIDKVEDVLEQRAKAAVLLMRLSPDDIKVSREREWGYEGIVAYSKICTHVGCPVGLYEQQTHHLLCPCHQSTFDVTEDCKVIFGPARRPLPQLPITVDTEGYLVAASGFHEAVGPSFPERG